jgi:hypothetical protein
VVSAQDKRRCEAKRGGGTEEKEPAVRMLGIEHAKAAPVAAEGIVGGAVKQQDAHLLHVRVAGVFEPGEGA